MLIKILPGILLKQAGKVELLAATDFDYALSADETAEMVIPGPGFVYAPVAEGADAGVVHVCIDGKTVGKVPLIYGETVEMAREEQKSLWKRLIGGD